MWNNTSGASRRELIHGKANTSAGVEVDIVGDLGSDNFFLGTSAIQNRSFTVASNVTGYWYTHTLRLGFSYLEDSGTKYSGFIDSLASQEVIASRVYSLYLNKSRVDS